MRIRISLLVLNILEIENWHHFSVNKEFQDKWRWRCPKKDVFVVGKGVWDWIVKTPEEKEPYVDKGKGK